MRVYAIGRDYQATELDEADAASRFMTWLADQANPALTEIIATWLWLPADAGGMAALAESPDDIARLRARVTAAWQHPPGAQGAQ